MGDRLEIKLTRITEGSGSNRIMTTHHCASVADYKRL